MRLRIYQVISFGKLLFEGTVDEVAEYLGLAISSTYERAYKDEPTRDGILVKPRRMNLYAVNKDNKIIAQANSYDGLGDVMGYSGVYLQQAYFHKLTVGNEYRILWEKDYERCIAN